MKQTIFFITSTDTGVGKTVLTVLLARFLCECGVNVMALKPISSGSRADALKISGAVNGMLSLGEINPWHFRATIAPLLAARLEKRSVKLSQMVAHVRAMQKQFSVLLIEGAGGLLSPLGQNFNSRDLIEALRATPIIVAQNRLGTINQILLTLEAVPKKSRRKARVILMSSSKPDAATGSNAKLLAEFFDARKIFILPWLGRNFETDRVLRNSVMRKTLRALASGF